MHWSEIPLHVIDFEGSPRSGVLEYGIVTLHEGRVTQTHTRLCGATGEDDPLAARTHGILARHTQGCMPFDQDRELFVGLRRSGPFVAHHAQVEDRFIRSAWSYPGAVPDYTGASESVSTWGAWMDSCQLAKVAWLGMESYKLGDLVEALALREALEDLARAHCPDGRRRSHCALYDALASALVLLRMLEEARWQQASVAQLLRESAASIQAYEDMGQQELF